MSEGRRHQERRLLHISWADTTINGMFCQSLFQIGRETIVIPTRMFWFAVQMMRGIDLLRQAIFVIPILSSFWTKLRWHTTTQDFGQVLLRRRIIDSLDQEFVFSRHTAEVLLEAQMTSAWGVHLGILESKKECLLLGPERVTSGLLNSWLSYFVPTPSQ